MDRLACVDLPALPLQLLLRRHPDWAGCPSAVVAEDKPQAPILWVNESAREHGAAPGLRYAQGLSLVAGLRAGVVSAPEIAAAVEELGGILRRFSPSVEPAAEPGLFWLDASGLSRLHPSLPRWARSIVRELGAANLRGAVVVGFTRFGTAALARLTRGARVIGSPEEERSLACRVPLKLLVRASSHREHSRATGRTRRASARLDSTRVDIDPALCDALARLGVPDVGGLLRLPAGGLLERFGPEAERLHRLAAAALWAPLQPVPEVSPAREVLELDEPETDRTRLLFLLKRRLDRVLWSLAERHEALAALHVSMRVDSRGESQVNNRQSTVDSEEAAARSSGRNAELFVRENRQQSNRATSNKQQATAQASLSSDCLLPVSFSLRPAASTLDGVQLLELVRLRLESLALPAGVLAVELQAEAAPAVEEQLQLFAQKPPRDLGAANRALARVRAEMGEGVVVRAVLRDKHLPEACFAWEPLERLELARVGEPRGVVGVGEGGEPEGRTGASCAPGKPREGANERLVRPEGLPAPVRPLVRRLLREAELLRGEDPGASHGPLYASRDLPPRPARQPRGGPYVLSGGWWRKEVCREYHFAESRSGALLWLYYDRQRRRWMLQGTVE